jgi:hypothetical protein
MTYRCNIEEQLAQIRNNTLNVFVLLNESMSLAVSDLANDIKGVELEPLCKVTDISLLSKEVLGLFQEQLSGVINKGFVLNQCTHREGRVDTSAELGVEVIIRGAEERCETVALDHGLLYNVKVGLR